MKPKDQLILATVALFIIVCVWLGYRSRSKLTKPQLFSPGVGQQGMTELHYAAYSGNLETLLACLKRGDAVDARHSYRGYTATHWLADMAATAGPRVEMLRALAAHGADLNAKAAAGETPLTLAREAAGEGGDELARELVKLGAKPE